MFVCLRSSVFSCSTLSHRFSMFACLTVWVCMSFCLCVSLAIFFCISLRLSECRSVVRMPGSCSIVRHTCVSCLRPFKTLLPAPVHSLLRAHASPLPNPLRPSYPTPLDLQFRCRRSMRGPRIRIFTWPHFDSLYTLSCCHLLLPCLFLRMIHSYSSPVLIPVLVFSLLMFL